MNYSVTDPIFSFKQQELTSLFIEDILGSVLKKKWDTTLYENYFQKTAPNFNFKQQKMTSLFVRDILGVL